MPYPPLIKIPPRDFVHCPCFPGTHSWQLIEHIKSAHRKKSNSISHSVKMLSLFIYYELFINIKTTLYNLIPPAMVPESGNILPLRSD